MPNLLFFRYNAGKFFHGNYLMNKPTFKQPTFQTHNENRFSEKRRHAQNSVKHDTRSIQNNEKNNRTFAPPPTNSMFTETTMENLKGHQVKVLVKGTTKNLVKEKKTGPLSPRAPEKIKKNRAEEMKVYGENACLSLFSQRPESIVRVWATVEMAHKIGELFSYLAKNKKVYHVVNREELELVSGTEHHGGICMLVKKQRPFSLDGYLSIARERDCLVLITQVHNPQNLGGIVRTCAVYGAKGIIIEEPELLQSANAMRVAEGGMEYVHILQDEQLDNALTKLRHADYQIIHTSMDKQAKSLSKVRLKNKVVLVLSESSTTTLTNKGDDVVNLSFNNPLKTGLNVAVQTGILLAKWVE